MSDRERWIVYPLLFFALGMATWNGMLQQTQQQSTEATAKSALIDSIRCKQLMVVNESNTPQIVLTTNARGGVISIFDPQGKKLVEDFTPDNSVRAPSARRR